MEKKKHKYCIVKNLPFNAKIFAGGSRTAISGFQNLLISQIFISHLCFLDILKGA